MNVTGSSADRASACPASHALPRVVNPTSDAAEKGIIVHNYIRGKLSGIDIEVPSEYKDYCQSIQLDTILNGINPCATEVSYLLDLKEKTAKLLGENIGRNYPEHGPYQIPLTVDLVGVDRSGQFYEIDWKTGNEVDEPEDNWQRKLCSIAVMLVAGADSIISKNVYLRDGGNWFEDKSEFNILDAYAFIDEFKSVIDTILKAREIISTGGVPDTFPGDHCNYCPAYNFCPAKTALVKKFSEDLTVDDLRVKLLSLKPEQQGKLLERVREVKAMAEAADKILKSAAERNPLPIDDDYQYAKIKRPYTGFSKDAAIQLLLDLGATKEQIENLTKTTTITQIRKVKRQ